MNPIGVIQGRLLKKYQGRFQAHPVDYWQDEFSIVKELELDCIEFILDFNEAENNPLICPGGLDLIIEQSEKTSVEVKTICADYFMEAPIHSNDMSLVDKSLEILKMLIKSSNILGVKDIVLPCVDQSRFKNQKDIEVFVTRVKNILSILEKNNVNLSLETDLPPSTFIELIERFDSDRITVNYDTGNSASLGYDLIEELDAYGHKISDIHIKDRILNGASVKLGEGDVDFETFFMKLKSFEYKGPFIMQAFRDDEGLEIFKAQLKWVKPYIEEYYA